MKQSKLAINMFVHGNILGVLFKVRRYRSFFCKSRSIIFHVVENENHCDFKKLRDSLIEKNMLDLIETTHSKHYEMFRRNRLTELGLADNIDGKQMSISDTLDMKRTELRQELEQREQQLKEAFIQKVKDKESDLKETEKQVG